ncbi:Chromate resistance protein ChrB [Actinosynnema sp. NPDC059335]|uniref:Chromate resistance protein ChrB n=1 Tax=Actinosynnema sp. NPDC059335 TaxID=3346804 RepID=UPI00366F0D5B
MAGGEGSEHGSGWVLLSYRLPREPSTPRISVWRKLKRLGVAQLGDGLAALPHDARTREQLEWLAEEVVQAGGTAMVWVGRPTAASAEGELAASLAAARAAEYLDVVAEATGSLGLDQAGRRAAARRLRQELHRIHRRDYFPPPERERARAAVADLAGERHQDAREPA